MNLPERFDLTYIDSDGTKKRPVMLHRVIYGSIERFIGILIEHYAGAFPIWLAPTQLTVIPVNPEIHGDYSNKLKEKLANLGIRVELDDRNEKLGYRMRETQMKKIPYSIIIGDKEMEEGLVSYRKFGEQGTTTVSEAEFIDFVINKINNKSL